MRISIIEMSNAQRLRTIESFTDNGHLVAGRSDDVASEVPTLDYLKLHAWQSSAPSLSVQSDGG